MERKSICRKGYPLDAMRSRRNTFVLAISSAIVAAGTSFTAGQADSVAAVQQPVALSSTATDFLKGLILVLVPTPYVDDDDWETTRRIQSGLNVKMDGLQLRTSRRWKHVNHGVWKRAEIRLHQPEKHLRLQVQLLPQNAPSISHYRLQIGARIRVHGRQQSWSNGVKLYSISGGATADVIVQAEVTLHRSIVETADGRQLRVLPHIESIQLYLDGFRLQRVGHAKGALVREFGRSLKSTLNRLVARKSVRIAASLNRKIDRKPERFEIPLGVFSLLAGPGDPLAADNESH